MAGDLDDPGPGLLQFLTERHLATLTTLRTDGSPHVVPVGVTYDAASRTARVTPPGPRPRRGTSAPDSSGSPSAS